MRSSDNCPHTDANINMGGVVLEIKKTARVSDALLPCGSRANQLKAEYTVYITQTSYIQYPELENCSTVDRTPN